MITELRAVLGFERWCWPLADPETLIPGFGIADHDHGPYLYRALELEYGGSDVAAKDIVARRQRPVGSLSTETHGDLARSVRWDEVLRPVGIGDTATLACRDGFGCWGWIDLHRDFRERPFDDDDLAMLADVGRSIAKALRSSVAHSSPSSISDDLGASDDLASGTIVLDAELRLRSQTASANDWIQLLPTANLFAMWGMLPPPFYPVATLARAGRADQARALMPAVTGGWVRVEGASLIDGNGGIALTLRRATASETLRLLSRAFGLTRRERELSALLLDGLDTDAVTRRLGISAHTVQDHLKSMFAKAGVRSRRELVAKLAGRS